MHLQKDGHVGIRTLDLQLRRLMPYPGLATCPDGEDICLERRGDIFYVSMILK